MITVNLAFGLIADIDPAGGRVKVEFKEETDEGGIDGNDDKTLVSDWLPISTRKSLYDKESFPYDINEHVWCMMDEYLEYGICCGALFNDVDQPDGAGADIYRLLYKDGSYENFDRGAGEKIVFYKGDFKASNNAGALIQTDGGKVKLGNATDTANTLLKDILAAVKLMTFTNGGGVTGVANNVASFTTLETRVDNTFS